jgi:hypothetical protein
MVASSIPRIGVDVEVCIASEAGFVGAMRGWVVEIDGLPLGWSAELRSKSETDYRPGERHTLWTFDIQWQSKTLLLSDTDFGRMPISDRMRPRYIRALRSILRLFAEPEGRWAGLTEDVSEFKGMLNRCLRKDQWDWLSVYWAFDRPHFALLRTCSQLTDDLGRALRTGTSEVDEHVARLRGMEIEPMLAEALATIEAEAPRLTGVTRPVAGAAPVLPTRVRDEGQGYTITRVAKAKLEQANSAHAATLALLSAHLTTHGFIPMSNRLIDLYCHLASGPAIFEVKSLTPENERAQCRHALSQLYEYRFLHSVPTASLWVVLSAPPLAGWLVDYLRQDRGVGVCWVDQGRVGGPDAERLTESGSAARLQE